MNLLQFAELLIDINLYIGLIPIVVALWLWKYQNLSMTWFAVNQICLFLIFLFSVILQKNNIPNHFINILHNLRFSILMPIIFWFYEKKNKNTLLFYGVIGILISVTPLFFKLEDWNPYVDSIISIFGTTFLLYYLSNIISKSSAKLINIPIFWIIIGLVISNVSGLFATYFSKQALIYSTEVFLIIWNILSIIGIICKLLYAVGFYVSKQKPLR